MPADGGTARGPGGGAAGGPGGGAAGGPGGGTAGGPGGARGIDARGTLLLVLGLVLVALNLRFALTSVGPLIDDLRADLHLSGSALGMLTTAPLLALGLVSPLAPRLADRWGAEHVVLGCMLAIGVGVALRWLHPVALLFGGALLSGCAIAVGNVLMPGIIKRRFGGRAATMTGVYSVGLSGGAALAAGLTVPIEDLVGDWRLALALWAAPALLAAVVWLPQLRRRAEEREEAARARAAARRAGVEREAGRPRVALWRDRRAWAVTLFMGMQSTIFYTCSAWLPEIVGDRGGLSAGQAGALLSLMMLLGIPIGFVTAAVAGRMRDQRPLAVVAAIFPAIGWLGLLLFPGVPPLVWAVVLGIGAGTGFPLVLTLFVLRARDVRHTAALSGMAQSVGYTLAALGPLAIGALHDATGAWTLPLVALALLGLPELLAALAASRPGYVGDAPAPVACRPEGVAPADARAAA
nr:MFS transporter [Conexibacter arvalis]